MKVKIFITQSKYIKEILKKFRMEDSKPVMLNDDNPRNNWEGGESVVQINLNQKHTTIV